MSSVSVAGSAAVGTQPALQCPPSAAAADWCRWQVVRYVMQAQDSLPPLPNPHLPAALIRQRYLEAEQAAQREVARQRTANW